MKTTTTILAFLLFLPSCMGAEYFGRNVEVLELRGWMLAAGIAADKQPNIFAGSHYTLVKADRVEALVALAKKRLHRDAGSKWDERFSCFAFSWNLVNEASKQLMLEKWREAVPPIDGACVRPAIIVISYVSRQTYSGHAICLVVTDSGPVFVDPQAGQVVLTAEELASIYYPAG